MFEEGLPKRDKAKRVDFATENRQKEIRDLL